MEKREHIVMGLIWQVIRVLIFFYQDSPLKPNQLEKTSRNYSLKKIR